MSHIAARQYPEHDGKPDPRRGHLAASTRGSAVETALLRLQQTAGNSMVAAMLRELGSQPSRHRSPGRSVDGGTDMVTIQRKVARKAARKTKKKKVVSTPVPSSCRDDARVCFSISAKRAWLLKPGKVAEVEVSALGGRKGHPTPTGQFSVIYKDPDHHSSKYKDPKTGKPAPMRNYVNFAPEVGFHAGSLTVESHGCVHLSPAAAKIFFGKLDKGDKVDVVP